jgi:hypothetical protein
MWTHSYLIVPENPHQLPRDTGGQFLLKKFFLESLRNQEFTQTLLDFNAT